MSSDCPPQLQLSIQPTTTSFKRSFEEFGFDLESPVGTRAVIAGESGTTHSTGNERNKRARSRTSLDSETHGSMGSSAASEASDGGNVGASGPTTTVEPPRLPTPVLPDVDMPSYPQEDEEESFPPRAGVPSPPTHPNATNAFQLTLDRFNAFDREMQVLRQPEPNLSTTTPSSSSSSISALVAPASPPILPPLIIDPHRLSTEAIDFLPEQFPVLPLSVSVSALSNALPDRSRESTGSPVRFRQNLDVALERLRSPSPLAPGFVFQDSPTTGDDEEVISRHTIEHGPPTLPPIPPIANDLHDNTSVGSEQDEEPPRPHVVHPNPPTLPPIPNVSDTSNVWDDDTATPLPDPVRVHARRDVDLPFSPLSPEIPPGYIDFERDFGQWFHPAEDSMSTSSVSTSAATAGTERETFGHAPVSASAAMPTSPQSPSSPLSHHFLRATQAVEERRQHLSSIAAAETEARRMLRSSAASSSPSRVGSSNTAPARSIIQDGFGTMANPFSLGNTARTSLADNTRPSSRYSYWEERRRNSLEIPTFEEGWAQFRNRLANEIEDTEHRLRRRPRFLGETAENPESHAIFSSRPRSEPDINTDFDIDFSSLLRAERHPGTQATESSSSGERRAPDSLHTNTESWLERMRRHRENRMVYDEEADDVGPSEFLNQLFARVSNEDTGASTLRSPPSTSRPNPRPIRRARPLAADADSGGGTTFSSLDDDTDRALWTPGGTNRNAANRRTRDRFPTARGRTATALPRPGASNSLVAESASEARRQADFESIRRRILHTNPWDDLGDEEETRTAMAMDVDEESTPSAWNPPTRRVSGRPRRPSPPPLRRNGGNPPTHLAHLDFEDFSLYPPAQASHSNRGAFDALTSSSPHRRPLSEHLASDSRTGASVSDDRDAPSSPTTARLPRAHTMVPPWELPDVSLPFGDLFATLGEGRNHMSHPQRSHTGRFESAPSLPHPDLGSTFTGQRYPPSDQLPAIPSDADIPATTRAAYGTSSRAETDNHATPTAETHRQSLLERHRRHVLDDMLRLQEGYGSPEMRNVRRGPPHAASHGSSYQNNATAVSAATSPNGGGPSRPPASSSMSSFSSRQAPGAAQTARHEPPRPGSYSTFLPGPFRNTLRHAERHVARTDSSSRSNLATPPVIPEMPFGRDQSSSNESPFTSRPLPAESFYIRSRETTSSMFSSSWYARETQRREAANRPDADFRQSMEDSDHEMEVLRRRHQEAYEARTRQLRERGRYRDPSLIRSVLQESMEMSRTMTGGERDSDSNSGSGETGNRQQPRRRFESLRLNSGAGMRRTRLLSDYMRDEDLDLLSYEGLLSLTELAGDVRPRATPADVLEKMEKSTYKEWKTSESDTRCPICLDDYEPDDPVQKLTNCSHWLHQECLGQWLKSANTCPVCRGSVAETRSSGGGRSARTRSAFTGVPGAGRWRDMPSQTGPPPPVDNPGVSRFYHHVAAENINRMTRRRTRLVQMEQHVASVSAQSATAPGSSSAPGTSNPANNNQGTGPFTSDSDDDQTGLGFLPHIYRRR
ncbi:hypothetical protein D9619_013590 [Psilocybe cf. subviscida]|uniref:RING-type domain-containing protein n=1 Tax=Psilocybe cf. subviscida TaxID=2480587 RepID=A0A8H5AQN7_9AGAR|nr:hypothetical protein D9619_013590 [Psilocybe cf. subviscida]